MRRLHCAASRCFLFASTAATATNCAQQTAKQESHYPSNNQQGSHGILAYFHDMIKVFFQHGVFLFQSLLVTLHDIVPTRRGRQGIGLVFGKATLQKGLILLWWHIDGILPLAQNFIERLHTVWLGEAMGSSVLPRDRLSSIEAGVAAFHDRIRQRLPIAARENEPSEAEIRASMRGVVTAPRQ